MLCCRYLLLLLAVLAPGVVWARQDPEPVRKAVEEHLRIHTQGLPGEVSYSVGGIDAQNNLAPCTALETFVATGTRLVGRTTVGVRCRGDAGWSIYVPVQIRVAAEYLVAARPLVRGQTLAESDIARRTGDLAELPAGILTDTSQATGRTVTASLAAGHPLRSDMLRQPLVLRQNQSVKVVSRGAGFSVATEGKALANAADGQVVQVRTASGRTVSGVARASGTVEVEF